MDNGTVGERGYLSIGEVLVLLKPEFADLTISKIRFLESQGLLDPERTPSGYRKFYEPDIVRLRWILRQQHENYLPLKVIRGKLGVDAEAAGVNGPVLPAEEDVGAHADVGGSAVADSRRLTRAAPGEPPSAVSVTLDELAVVSGLSPENVGELVRFGLMAGKSVGGTVYYDEDALAVAQFAARFMHYGVEARHLRMYRTSAEREASFFEQVVMPMLKQRNPQARRQAVDALQDLAALGQGLRAALLRRALRDYTGA
jgi:hypothetical protein